MGIEGPERYDALNLTCGPEYRKRSKYWAQPIVAKKLKIFQEVK